MKRLSSLDYLRGLAAFGIMVFHYSMWTFGLFRNAEDIPGRIGIYGVAIFYILSGITLYHVYYDKIGAPSKRGLSDFAIKRIFRIFPLLWLISIATLLIKKDTYPIETIVFNFTGLFSVYHWFDTVSYGAWSIGNELVFYLFFPVFIFLSKRSRALFVVLSTAILFLYVWFAFIRIARFATIDDKTWADYTNPLNQVFLFLCGYLAAHLSKNVMLNKRMGVLLILTSALALLFIPVKGDIILLITGFNRLVFTALCVAICFSFYKTDLGLKGVVRRFFSMLGEISYSVYLVHPLTWYILSNIPGGYFSILPPPVRLLTGFTFTILIAYMVYQLFERYFMKIGSRVSKKVNPVISAA